MAVPSRLTLYNVRFVFDGGTRHLYATDERGAEHRITLVQRMQQISDPRELPGRLYFDDDLVAVRSDLESDLLRLLKTAELSPCANAPPDSEILRGAVNALISFVESDAYVSLALGR